MTGSGLGAATSAILTVQVGPYVCSDIIMEEPEVRISCLVPPGTGDRHMVKLSSVRNGESIVSVSDPVMVSFIPPVIIGTSIVHHGASTSEM